ncbi:MAG: universal stress protein [Flavobacteriales bacterium]
MKEYKIKNILVPTDFSETANNAMKTTVAMAQRHKATLHLINCISPLLVERPLDFKNVVPGINNFIYKITEKDLTGLKEEIEKKYSFPVVMKVEIGAVPESVKNYIDTYSIDIVVMGAHGVSGWKDLFIGSNTMEVIKKSTCPVLSIPNSFSKRKFDKVLCPMREVIGVVEKYNYLEPILEKNDSSVHLLVLNKFNF